MEKKHYMGELILETCLLKKKYDALHKEFAEQNKISNGFVVKFGKIVKSLEVKDLEVETLTAEIKGIKAEINTISDRFNQFNEAWQEYKNQVERLLVKSLKKETLIAEFNAIMAEGKTLSDEFDRFSVAWRKIEKKCFQAEFDYRQSLKPWFKEFIDKIVEIVDRGGGFDEQEDFFTNEYITTNKELMELLRDETKEE